MPAFHSVQISLPLGFEALAARLSVASRQHSAALLQCASQKNASSESDFTTLYVTWWDSVLGWTTALGVRSCDTHDIAQSVFLVVHRRLPYCDRKNIGGWLYRITANQVRDYRRQLWNRAFFRKPEPRLDFIPSPTTTPIALLETLEARRLLDRALSGLSEATRATFVLFDIQGFTCEEIALLHNVVPNTVWARLRRARRRVVPHLLKWRRSDRMPA